MSEDLPPLLFSSRKPTIHDVMLGGAPLGGLFSAVPPDVGRATVAKALDMGITKFDTAPLYGLGESELLMGDVLSKARVPIELWTKVGRVLKRSAEVSPADDADVGHTIYKVHHDLVPVFDFSSEGVRHAYEGCVTRLRAPISGLRIHDADTPARFASAMGPNGAVAELVRMRERGEIRYVSAGLNDASYLVRYAHTAPRGTFDSFMCAGCWNLLDQTGYELLRVCQLRGIKLTNAGIFGSGILWGGSTLRYSTAPADALAKVARWEQLATEYSLPLPAVALAFALLPAAVTDVAIGCRTPEEVERNVALLQYSVPGQLWADAQNRGLLPAWLPLPPRA